jgi:transcriptional antiterminator RfaH
LVFVDMPEISQGGRGRDAVRWCVVQTQAHCELRAAAHLRNQSFKVFLPLHRKTVRHARQFRAVLAPLFPCYLFVAIAIDRDRWTSIKGTVGVVRLLMEGDLPRPVPRGVVEGLGAIADAHGIVRLDSTILPGDTVRITTGAFAGLVGKLASLDANGRVSVLLDVLGKEVVATGTNVGFVPAA